MRVTTNMQYQHSIKSLQSASERLDKANNQMTSGSKFTTAGEDPTGMSSKLSLTSKIESYQQYNTNAGLLDSSLTLEGTVLTSVTTSLQSAYSKVQQSQSGAISTSDRKSIASELTQLQNHIYDMMNSKNADGEYIFGGNQSQTQPFIKDSSGQYVFQGDTGQRMVQVSPSVNIAANDSGLSVFQSVPTRRAASTSDLNLTVGVTAQSEFDNFFRTKYDFSTPANNTYSIITTANPNTYQIFDNSGSSTPLQNGNYSQGEAITFNGLSLTIDTAANSTQTFSLDAPQNDNVLNTISDMISALNDTSITDDDYTKMAANVQVHIKNTLDRVDITQGAIGGRQNNLEQVVNTNTSLSSIGQEARANVSEIDIYDAISKVSQEESTLSLAQKAFAQVNKSTLFDYL
nr:flagellar hook-associated protein FlgL [uncultured Tolumonas sp.]